MFFDFVALRVIVLFNSVFWCIMTNRSDIFFDLIFLLHWIWKRLRGFVSSFLLFLVVWGNPAFSLQANSAYVVEQLNSSNGLPSDNIKDVFQDRKGFIWLATTEGLIRFDGYDLEIYSIASHYNKGMITNMFFEVSEDSSGRLWCATDRGLACFDPMEERFDFFNRESAEPFQLLADVINSVQVDQEGLIWIGTAGHGVEVLDPGHGVVERYNVASSDSLMNSDWITRLYVDSGNRVWVGTWKGALSLIDRSAGVFQVWTNKELQLTVPHFSPFSLVEESRDVFWLGLWEGGLVKFRLEGDSLRLDRHYMPDSGKVPGDVVYDLKLDKGGDLWIGSPFGLGLLDDPNGARPTLHVFKSDRGFTRLADDEAYALLVDASGLLWVGSSGGGVHKLDKKIRLFTPYHLPDISPNFKTQSVTAFSRDPEGRLLLGVRSLGFGSYDLSSQRFVPYGQMADYRHLPVDINTVTCFCWDAMGTLWLGTRYMGIIRYDPQSGQSVVVNKDEEDYDFAAREISDIYEDGFGHIWVGTENGLYKIVQYDSQNFLGFNVMHYEHRPGDKHSISSNRISKIMQDREGVLWVATYDHGLNRLVSDIRSHFPLVFERVSAFEGEANGMITDNVNTIFSDAEGHFWMGTAGGGLFWKHADSDSFKSLDGRLPGTNICDIQQDHEGFLWVSTNRGLTRLQVSGVDVEVNNFLEDNGLQGNIFNKGAGFKDEHGNLLFGGNNGLNFFDPESVRLDDYSPPVVITELKVMNEEVVPLTSLDDPLVLTHLTNNFSVTFSALSYSQPQNHMFAVKLEGLDTEWRRMGAGARTLDFSNLKPGSYVLKIRAANGYGVWSPQEEELFLKVKPAPYKTGLAYLGYSLVLGLVILLFFKMEQNNQKVKQALAVEHIEREKSDALNHFKQGVFANVAHEFFTPLSILSCLLEDWKHARSAPNSRDVALAERNIVRLNRLNKQFLYFSKSEEDTLPLRVSKGDLKYFVEQVGHSFLPLARRKGMMFDILLDFPEQEVWFDVEKLDVVLYNVLSNALKFTPEGGQVQLRLWGEREEGALWACFEVSDSGDGISSERQRLLFDRHHSISGEQQNGGGFGIGLALSKAMAEAHKGQIELFSPPSGGTEVRFRVPVSRSSFSPAEMVRDSESAWEPMRVLLPERVEEETLLRIRNLSAGSEDRPSVLLVDQHADFRSMLRSNLEPLFQVLETNNGVAAYELIQGRRVDLIVSDLVVPGLDGLTLCKRIKSGEKTSDIPFILLTARSSDSDKASGYRAGADSYMVKPFNLNTLLTRVEALLANSRRKKELQVKPNGLELAASGKDDEMLSRVRTFIEENLANSDLSVKLIVRELGISNSMLYRKCSEVLNINPNTMIRKLRMARAVELLSEGVTTVSEVSLQCGFKDLSYFGSTFKKEFGVSPSQYNQTSGGI